MIRLWPLKRLRLELKRWPCLRKTFSILIPAFAGSVAYQIGSAESASLARSILGLVDSRTGTIAQAEKNWAAVAEARIPESAAAFEYDRRKSWHSLFWNSDTAGSLLYPWNAGRQALYSDPFNTGSRFTQSQMISQLCERLAKVYAKYGWNDCPCSQLKWTFAYRSEMGHPLLYWEYVDEDALRVSPNRLQTTLILGGVHADELTPIHLAFEFARALNENPDRYRNSRVIIAPLVNPDGLFTVPLQRTNSNGVDLNRNFATADWWHRANKNWASLRKRDPRHFPGEAPNTEQGTRFQAYLIHTFEPDKILTIHAPLGFLDYDGPGESGNGKTLTSNEIKAFELAEIISKRSNNYRIMNYTIYPGSLGNYAGNDRRIPTITVELDSTDPRKALAFKRAFFPGLNAAVKYEFQRDLILVSQGDFPAQKLPHGATADPSSSSDSESGKF